MGTGPDVEQVRLLEAAVGHRVEPFSRGGDSATYRLAGTEDLVALPTGWPRTAEPADEVERRAALLARLGDRVTLPVPRVVRRLPEAGLVVVRRLPGRPLLDLPPDRRAALAPEVGAALGGLLAELHTWPPDALDDLVDVDETLPEEWHREAASLVAELAPVLDHRRRAEVRRFLERTPPPPAPALAFSHLDLGAEHVLVGDDGRVTGLVDWDDAAVGDPAHDLSLVLRDLGPAGLEAALGAYAEGGGEPGDARPRIDFLAGCQVLEDLAFGHARGRPSYVGNALRAWEWTLGAD